MNTANNIKDMLGKVSSMFFYPLRPQPPVILIKDRRELTPVVSLEEFIDCDMPLKEYLILIEAELISQSMVATGDNKTQAAKLLRVNRTTLVERIKTMSFLNR